MCDHVPKIVYGKTYKFKGDFVVLTYIGKSGLWYQFEKLGVCGIWCEILEYDLHLLEKVE